MNELHARVRLAQSILSHADNADLAAAIQRAVQALQGASIDEITRRETCR